MAQARGDLDLAQEALGADRQRELGAQELDRDHPLVPEVAGEEHGRHPAPSQLAHEGVAARQGRAEPFQDVGHSRGTLRRASAWLRVAGDHPARSRRVAGAREIVG